MLDPQASNRRSAARRLPALAAPRYWRLAVAALLTVAAACGGTTTEAGGTTSTATSTPPSTAPSSTTATTTVTSSTSVDDVRADVQADFFAWQDAYERIATTAPDPDSPDLERWLEDPALGGFRQQLLDWRSRGLRLAVPANSVFDREVEVVSVGPDTATLVECLVDDRELVDVATGDVLPETRGAATYLSTVELVHVDGRWQVREGTSEQRWDGAMPGCGGAL